MSMTDISLFPPEEDEDVLAEQARQEQAKLKEYALKHATVTINRVEFDTNTTGQLNMSAVGAIANWQFNVHLLGYLQTLENPSEDLQGFIQIFGGVYKSLYKDTKVAWKGADNEIHNVQVESILEALKAGMDAKGNMYTNDTK